MKTIRSLMTLVGLSMMVFALSATGAKAQSLTRTNFAGTFTISHEAQWGNMTLPAGNYSLRYGVLNNIDFLVEVRGMTKGSPHGVIRVAGRDDASASKSALVCVREGGTLIVRKLEMPTIGTTAEFTMPHGARLVARNAKHNGYTQLAEAPMLIEQIPVTFNSK
jgi:hypothetical protein